MKSVLVKWFKVFLNVFKRKVPAGGPTSFESNMNIAGNILKNAIDSLEMGMEDFKSTDEKRLLSSTRNIVAGVLLFVKYVMVDREGVEAIKVRFSCEKVVATNSVRWVEDKTKDKKKTVDVFNMKKRCELLNINVQWDNLGKLIDKRNDIEHFYNLTSSVALRGLISNAYYVLWRIIRDNDLGNPEDVLGEKIMGELTELSGIYNNEKGIIQGQIDSFDWKVSDLGEILNDWCCVECGSNLIRMMDINADRDEVRFKCVSCRREYLIDDAIEFAVSNYYAADNHYSVKDGGDPVVIECGNCVRDTYHTEKMVCFNCLETMDSTCKLCGDVIPVSELDGSGYCGYCIHKMEKAQRE